MKENIKKAFADAEQELQEKEVANLKKIVTGLLKKKAEKEEDKRELEKEISVIKQTIDDFKAGRLDKVKELIEKDEIAERLLPFKVVIINQTVYNQPWKWQYQLTPTVQYYGGGVITTTGYSGTSNLVYTSASSLGTGTSANYCSSGLSGSNYSTFTSGAYDVGGKIINL